MIRKVLKKLHAILNPSAASNGKTRHLDPVGILREGCHGLQRLAEQISTHAAKAPYLQVAQRLRQIASEKRDILGILREKILVLGGNLEEPQLILKSGKNHWERMVQDLEDQRALEIFFSEQAVRLADEDPEISDLLRSVLAAQLPHKEIFLDLVVRADPQAEQN